METTTRTLEHLLPLAIQSYNGTSFSPERRGETVVNDYSAELDADLETIRATGSNYGVDPEMIEGACTRYKVKYTSSLSAYLYSHSNIVSTMIAGPSNFPVRQMEKRNRWADNKYSEFREYRTRALKAIVKSFTPAKDPLAEAKKNLALRERSAIIYREANKVIRNICKDKNATVKMAVDALAKLGIPEEQARKLITPDFAGRRGFPSFSLQNNNANIARLKQRVAELEARATEAKTIGEASKMFGDIELVKNYEADRLQIKFPGKPESEMISKLKSNGFKWSPRYMAWQRQLTQNALYATWRILGGEAKDYTF